MTVIKQLKLHGFKSFAKTTEIPFSNGYSVVVGSNGSGKSNIVDSMMFVLGSLSAKTMRAEKAPNLIYNGGKIHEPAKHAQVDIIFDNSKKEFPINDKEVKISNAKIGGSPLYYINGQEAKLDQLIGFLPSKEKEACELLRTRQVLKDKDCEPSIRVALRSIKDFAIPFEHLGELNWRWHLTKQEDAFDIIGKLSERKLVEKIKKTDELRPKEIQKARTTYEDGFFDSVNMYFKSNSVEILEHKAVRKNREIEGRIRVNSDLGKLDYFFIARNKKKLNDADLILASELGRKNKLPVLFMSNGELSKKAQTYLESNLRGNILFRKI